MAVTNEPKINNHPYFILSLLLSKNIKILAAEAAISKSVVAEDTAGVLPQSARKFRPCLIANKLKYQVPIRPATESKR